LPNFAGLVVAGGSNNTIGGAVPRSGNVVSGNTDLGMHIITGTRNLILGNFLGTDPSGTISLPNYDGLLINSDNNFVGGADPGQGNRIAFNQNDGVFVDGGIGNAIRGNSIACHQGLGIELAHGGNNSQEFPVLISAASVAGQTLIQGTLSSAANTDYILEFFANSAPNPSGYGEGETFLGSVTVTTDDNGTANFKAVFAVAVEPGQFIAATATSPQNDTSAFSLSIQVTGAAPAIRPPGPMPLLSQSEVYPSKSLSDPHRVVAAIHVEDFPGDGRGQWATDEDSGIRHFFRFNGAGQRRPLSRVIDHLVDVADGPGGTGSVGTGGDQVDANLLGT